MRRYLRRPKGHLGIRRAECLCSFSQSASAALRGSFFSVRAGNVSFLEKRPPWPGVEVSRTSFHEVSYEEDDSSLPDKVHFENRGSYIGFALCNKLISHGRTLRWFKDPK